MESLKRQRHCRPWNQQYIGVVHLRSRTPVPVFDAAESRPSFARGMMISFSFNSSFFVYTFAADSLHRATADNRRRLARSGKTVKKKNRAVQKFARELFPILTNICTPLQYP